MKVIFVSGPYSADSTLKEMKNVIDALMAAEKLWEKGWAVICPHGNSMLMNGEWEMFIRGCMELVKRSDAMVMIGDWKQSKGAMIEYNVARKLGIPIYYSVEDVPYAEKS